MPEPHEQDLLSRARKGDQGALAELLRAHQGRVFNVCLRMVHNRDDAAELTQDVLLKIVQHLPEYRGQAELSTWMTRIAMNQSISHLRKRKLRQTASLDGSSGGGASRNGRASTGEGVPALRLRLADDREPGPEARVERDEMLDRLRQAVAELDEEFRAVLVLRDIEEMDYAQVAEALGLPMGTVKSRLFRARLALREKMVAMERSSDRAGEGGDFSGAGGVADEDVLPRRREVQ